MRNVVSIFRLLTLAKEQAEEAKMLSKAIKRGKADIDLHIKVEEGDIKKVVIGNLRYDPPFAK